jgi:hypothetical protein
MEISLNIGTRQYHGTAVPYEKPGTAETQFVIRFEEIPLFHINMPEKGKWASDDFDNPELVSLVGKEIEKNDDHSVSIISNGEIINEPDDVDEHAFDNK